MCGIVGYIGKHSATEVLLEGLKRLEYRGYDSAGIALLHNNDFQRIRTPGRVSDLITLANQSDLEGTHGIGHTRWATHGGICEDNTHPHKSSDGLFMLVHNGVVENHQKLKNFLLSKGFTFSSETDTEVIVNLIAYYYSKQKEYPDPSKNLFLESVRKTLRDLEGTYGIAVICKDFPSDLIGARKSSPLILGIGEGEFILSSDVSAFAMRTKNVIYLNDNEIVHVSNQDFTIQTVSDKFVRAVIETVEWNEDPADLGIYSHYMEKEIFEQPTALLNSMRGRFSDDESTAHFGGLNLSAQELRQVDRLLFCACGTAWHACLVAKYIIERFARIPVEVDYASEFRYRNSPLDKNTLFFVISQSGETLDTLSALKEAKRKGYYTLAISNIVGSTIAREANGGIYQHVGPEIGVASTKAFTSQILITTMLALFFGRLRDLSFEAGTKLVEALKNVPAQVQTILNNREAIKKIALKYANYDNCLFLGRQLMFPIALEGALKLKEISYIHAEGYPAAEMKHGPIALISPEVPTVFLAPQNHIFQKCLSNMQELKARKGPLITVTSEENAPLLENISDDLILIPQAHEAVQPILATIPLQLLAYEIALARGCDVDKPRNLAKAVTVE